MPTVEVIVYHGYSTVQERPFLIKFGSHPQYSEGIKFSHNKGGTNPTGIADLSPVLQSTASAEYSAVSPFRLYDKGVINSVTSMQTSASSSPLRSSG